MITASNDAPRVRVVTVNYEGGDLTLRCIEHLRRTRWPDEHLELVVVDNGSHDGVADSVRQRWPDVRVIRSDENLGFAGGSNLGLADLDDVDFVALINNDVTVLPDWLTPLVDALRGDDGLGAACPKVLFEPRWFEVELRSTTTRRGRGDARDLGVRVHAVEIDGADVLAGVQWLRGFWGPEPDAIGRWSDADAVLRVPVPRDSDPPRAVRLRLEGTAHTRVEVAAGASPERVDLTNELRWVDVPVAGEPFDVINSAGAELTPTGFGADRGYLAPDGPDYSEPCDVFAWSGAAVLLRREYLLDVGVFDEGLFLYYEDLELSWRGRERGWRSRYVPDSVVRHEHSATVGEHSWLARYQNERNRLLVLARHAPLGTTARAAGRSLLTTASYARRDIASPLLRGEAPRPAIVRDRLHAFGGFLRRLPGALQARRTTSPGTTSSRATASGTASSEGGSPH